MYFVCCILCWSYMSRVLSHAVAISKVKHQALDLWSLPALVWIYVSFERWQPEYLFLFLNESTLLCCIDLEINPWCLVNPKARILWRSRKGGGIRISYRMVFSRNKWKCWWYSFLNYFNISYKFVELLAP